jgi:oxalate decarboxylase
MTSEIRQPQQLSSVPDAADQSGQPETGNFPRRSLLKGTTVAAATLGALGGIALPAGVASAATHSTRVRNTSTQRLSAGEKTPDSFKFRLEASEAQVFAGGTNKSAVAGDLEELSGLSLFSQRINPGAMRELHWHPNAHELSHCLSGQGEIGIFFNGTAHAVFPIEPGSTTFVPMGATHYIRNTGADVLHVIVVFSNESPEHIDFSDSLGFMPRSVLAQTYSIPTASFPALPQQGDQFLVNVGQIPPVPPQSSPTPFTVNVKDIPPEVFAGGTVAALTPQIIPSLTDVTLFFLQAGPGGLREPHWHQNASELNYLVQGRALVEIIAPEEHRESFVAEPGDVAFIPQNYFHFISSISDEPLVLLVFFSNSTVGHIDLSQITGFFQRSLIAASFGSDLHLFDNIPNVGDVTLAPRNPNP